jgi:hypothetical protein
MSRFFGEVHREVEPPEVIVAATPDDFQLTPPRLTDQEMPRSIVSLMFGH